MPEQEKIKQFRCANCQNRLRPHRILHECEEHETDTDPYDNEEYLVAVIYHRFLRCNGCDAYKYAVSVLDHTREGATEVARRIFPDVLSQAKGRDRRIAQETDDAGKYLIPEKVWKMYNETIDAVNANILTLAGGGLRATVEAICKEQGITGGDLKEKIDKLETKKLLTPGEATLLHEERYLGNDALHEMMTPSADEIEDGLEIVEHLIKGMYILPTKGKRLEEKRNARKNKM